MRQFAIALLLATLPVSDLHADNHSVDDVFNIMIEKYPYDFGNCFTDHPLQGQCEAPEALKQIELTSNINIEVILDASGSMAGYINNQRKYDIAIQALREFTNVLPKHINIGLRVYGHQGSNKEQDKSFSCASGSLVYPFQKLDPESFMAAVNSYKPTGWTALGHSLEQALEDFNRFDSSGNSNIIYLLTDGKETCGGDPVAAAAAINASSINAVVNAIGFDVDAEAAISIQNIADAGGGQYFSANNLEELVSVFTDNASWNQWRRYFECRRTAANRNISKIQGIELDRYNCVLDLANANTSLIEAELITNYPNLEFDVMTKILEHQYKLEEPHTQRYSSDAFYNLYMKEVQEIENIWQQMESPQ